MCKFFSCIVTKSDDIFWSTSSDSHEDIIESHNLYEGSASRGYNFVRIEATPVSTKKEHVTNPDSYSIDLDQATCPRWFVKKKQEIFDRIKQIIKSLIISDKTIPCLLDKRCILVNCKVKCISGCNLDYVFNSSVDDIRDSKIGQISDSHIGKAFHSRIRVAIETDVNFYDHSYLYAAYNTSIKEAVSSKITHLYATSSIKSLRNSTIDNAHGKLSIIRKSIIEYVGVDAVIESMEHSYIMQSSAKLPRNLRKYVVEKES